MKFSHRFQFFEYSKKSPWPSRCHSVLWMLVLNFQFEKKKTLKLGHGCLITLFLCGCNYRSLIPFQVKLHVISASKINQHRVLTGLSCFIITISKSQWYVMIIHMKPGAKKSRPFFLPRGPAMVYILWNLLFRNKAVISCQAWFIAIEAIGWK